MKIQFNGDSAVDIPGIDGVQPGQMVEVADPVGESLLLAGATFAADGTPILPDAPLWVRAGKTSTPEPAPAVTE